MRKEITVPAGVRRKVISPSDVTSIAVLTGLLFAQILLLVLGSVKSGVSVDEQVHTSDLHGEQFAANPDHWHFGVYGVSFQILANTTNTVFGNEDFLRPELDSDSYFVRHLVVVFLGLLTTATVALVVWLITTQKTLALWAAVAVLSFPVFAGHSFFNPKDIPVALGYTLVTCACVAYLRLPAGKAKRRYAPILIGVISSLGFWIASGTRLVFLLPLFLTVTVTVILGLFTQRKIDESFDFKLRTLGISFGSCAGVLMVLATHPCVIADDRNRCDLSADSLLGGVASNLQFPSGAPTPLFGFMVSGEAPEFWFLPAGIWATIPILIGLFAFVGFFFYWENITLARETSNSKRLQSRYVLVFMGIIVSMQIFLVPTLTVLSRGHTYLRHHLYVYPAVAILAACGVSLVMQWARGSRIGQMNYVVKLLALAAVLIPSYEAARLFPYSYVYVNPVAAATGYSNRWETDYWATSFREALDSLPEGQDALVYRWPQNVAPFVNDLTPVSSRDLEGMDRVNVLFPRSVGLGWLGNQVGCAPRDSVSRHFRNENLVMSYVLSCDTEILKAKDNIQNYFRFTVR